LFTRTTKLNATPARFETFLFPLCQLMQSTCTDMLRQKKIKSNFQHAGQCLNSNYEREREREKVDRRERCVNIDGETSEERDRESVSNRDRHWVCRV